MRDNILRMTLPAVLCLALAGCGSSAHSDDADGYTEDASDYGAADREEVEERAAFDEDAARDAAEEEVASESYQSIGSPYGCTEDCSGHEAGFAWRRDNGYATPGNSNSFDEGGRAFDEAVEEKVDDMRSSYEGGEEPEY